MESMALKDPDVYPDKQVLREVLGDSYPSFEELTRLISEKEFDLVPEWRFYNDGKAWLCKVVHKQKTVLWLSVWEGFFRCAFYFTAKNEEAIAGLDIGPEIKKSFAEAKRIGKLIPLVFVIRETSELKELLEVIRYKIKARVVK